MKNLFRIFCFFSILIVFACGREAKSNAFYETKSQFSGFINDLNAKFTPKAAYSSIMLSYDKLLGNSILVKVAQDIDSNKLEEWFFMNGSWEKKSELELKLDGNKPSDLLFTINGDFDMSKLVKMVDVSKEKVLKEKNAKNVECKNVSLLMKNKAVTSKKMDGLIIYITVETADGSQSYDLGFNSKGDFEGFSN